MSHDEKAIKLLPPMENWPIDCYEGVVLLPNLITVPLMCLWANDTLPPEVEYQMEPFKWGLPAVQIWCF